MSGTTCRILAQSRFCWRRSLAFAWTTAPRSSLCLRQIQARTSTLVGTWVVSTSRFGIGFAKTPSLLEFCQFLPKTDHETHLLSTRARASHFDPVRGIGPRADDPRPVNSAGGQGGKNSVQLFLRFATPLAPVRPGWQPKIFSQQFCTPTSTGGMNEISPAPPHPRALARACPGLRSEFSTCFSDAPADSSLEVLAVTPGVDPSLALPEHAPCLVGGISTLGDASFTTTITVHNGYNALGSYVCVELLHTGSPQNVRRDVSDIMLSLGAASVA